MDADHRLRALIERLNADLELRTAGPSDGPAFVALLNRQYRRQKPASYFDWRFLACPRPSQLVVALHGNRLVACMGGHVFPLTDGRCVLFAVDLLIDHAFRNRGLHHLLEARLQAFGMGHGAVALTSLPNPRGRDAHLSVPGCQLVGEVATLAQRPSTMVPTGTWPVSPGPPPLGFARAAEYARWRYAENPEYGYFRLELPHGGWVVFKNFRDPASGAVFTDLVDLDQGCAPDVAVLTAAVRAHPEVGASAVLTAWAPAHTARHTAFTRAGFVPQGEPRAFCVRPFSAGHEDLLDFSRWDLAEADSEIF
jgi:hypothetical protein